MRAMDTARDMQRRLDEITQEIRSYPGPIARCDLHLPALLEERRRLAEALAQLASQATRP